MILNTRRLDLAHKQVNRKKLSEAVSRVVYAAGRGVVAFVGDSTTAGAFAGDANAHRRSGSYPSRLCALFNAAGIPSQDDNIWGAAELSWSGYYEKLSIATGWGAASGLSLGGNMWVNASNSNPLIFTPSDNTNTFTVYYPNHSAFCPFNITDNSGHTKTVTPSGTSQNVVSATLGVADGVTLGANTYSITRNGSSSVYVVGFEAYDSTAPKLAFWNMGWSGAKSTDWSNSAQPYSPNRALLTLSSQIDHVDINLGINDWSYNTGRTAFYIAMSAIKQAVTICGQSYTLPFPTSVDSTTYELQDAYNNEIKSIAKHAQAPIVDFKRLFSSWETANSNGYAADGHHPNKLGYNLMATAKMDTLL
jgi:lysophospholipase L1-like esterase